ncbi:ABC-type Fe3+ transport system, periplasmic component [Cupriavidus necator]|uniref:ABC-type transporter, periplasmic component: FeTfamily n=1 Tax=Cupriavidus necator (strain ATCC 17699 / DSM 428 / KCTC 22496 / NCIMB 10442 / H16 / Stanier 337) TaxID=381666 RepID=Q0KDL4_CUPNH|nr:MULTISPECIES: Fe(3+) ABC transporter substrate-binding protein [Cupriavidus]KUE89559.1 Fe(3+) ABC transporter substrate-binding protein [Cupriavidus necator]QCB99837.1 Fe(3+) ABC transporter substrate-binding protein [Cupriavidus necator H16]QQB77347.1 Fe(3+) ABC transporter substrate-binding protein [Cupriavidus necator]WKA41679.1 Fe(3+) ABC transporter substrate-binding protein [Cupriavidus necator]CAJ91907.1 ABC-type transporter, periplasmic component: FeTfamily [Cupriavidus necator H16]
MKTTIRTLLPRAAALALLTLPLAAAAQEKVLNLYTARHYQTDEALYANFTKQTGIKINRIEGQEDPLLERIRNEGANSPADVFITVDIGRLWRAQQAGVFAPVKSKALESRIPANYRDPNGEWFGFSARGRVIAYNKTAVKAGDIASYEDLADPKWKGKVCTRSSGHVYNLSLVSSLIAHDGEARTEQWARGVAANLARVPKGGDTDQLKAVAAGECDVAIANTYYIARLLKSTKPEDKAVADKLGVLWPNQSSQGVHMNVSGGGMLKHAPNKEAAVKFLEYLASDEAQRYFADGNNEWPVVQGVKVSNPALEALGTFKADTINVAELGKYQPQAQKLVDRAGFK